VFLLRKVFDYEYCEIREIVDHDEAACHQIPSRARRELAKQRRRFRPSVEAHRRILASFMLAVSQGDMEGLTATLTADVVLWTDGRGNVRGAATRPVRGASRSQRSWWRRRDSCPRGQSASTWPASTLSRASPYAIVSGPSRS